MMKSRAIPYAWVMLLVGSILAAAPLSAQQWPPPPVLAIIGATLIDGTGAPPLPDAIVVVRGERIACVGHRDTCPVPEGAELLDARGRWILPGLVDTHVHFFGPTDWLAWYLANGITTIRDASRCGEEDQKMALRPESEDREVPWPRIYVSGRIDSRCVAQHGAADAAELALIQVERGVDALKIRRGISIEDVLAVVEVAGRSGVPVWGHTHDAREGIRGQIDYTDEAIRGGVSGVTHADHLAPVTEEHRPPEPEAAWSEENNFAWWLSKFRRWSFADSALLRQRMQGFVDHGAWLEPTLMVSHFIGGLDPEVYERADEPACIRATAAMFRQARLPFSDEERALYAEAFEGAKGFIRALHDMGGLVIAGTDGLPVPGVGVHHEMELFVDAGLLPLAALQAATRNAARALRWEDRIGTVEPGKLADLLILEADPLEDISRTRAIWRVVKGGRIHNPKELREVMERCEPSP